MNRLTHATKSTDLYGSGKHGYTDGVPSVTPATVLNSVAMNPIQEELARAVEAFTTLNSGNLGQLATILTTLLTSAGGSTTLQQSASTPVFATVNDANDHPSSASNKWKLILRMPCSDGTTFARLYAGDGDTTGGICITWNAVWNPASGSQTWSQDSGSYHSSQLIITSTDLRWRGKSAGSGAWGTTSWDTRGDYYVGRDLYVARDANITGDVSIAGSIVNPKASGPYAYTTPVDRTVNIDLAGCTTDGTWSTTSEAITLSIGKSAIFGLHVPHGCVLKGVKLKVAASLGTANYTVACTRKYTIDYTTATTPTYTLVGTNSTSVTSGIANNTAITFGSLTASRDESYSVLVACTGGSTADLVIEALAVVVSEVQLGVTV